MGTKIKNGLISLVMGVIGLGVAGYVGIPGPDPTPPQQLTQYNRANEKYVSDVCKLEKSLRHSDDLPKGDSLYQEVRQTREDRDSLKNLVENDPVVTEEIEKYWAIKTPNAHKMTTTLLSGFGGVLFSLFGVGQIISGYIGTRKKRVSK
jgi:hypothetical protein